MAYGFFVPIFFIHVGLRLEITLELLTNNFFEIILLVGIMFVSKFIPGLLLVFRKMDFKQITATCSLLAAPLTLVIAIMELGVHNGGVTAEMSAKVITAGILASLLFPSFARKLLKDSNPVNSTTSKSHSPH
jgi:trk system potassium uptake protein TrkA